MGHDYLGKKMNKGFFHPARVTIIPELLQYRDQCAVNKVNGLAANPMATLGTAAGGLGRFMIDPG